MNLFDFRPLHLHMTVDPEKLFQCQLGIGKNSFLKITHRSGNENGFLCQDDTGIQIGI